MYTVNISILFALGLIILGIGFVLGILINTLRASASPPRSPATPKLASKEEVNYAIPSFPEMEEIVRFERRTSDGTLVATFADGERLEASQPLTDSQRKKLIRVATDLKNWLVPPASMTSGKASLSSATSPPPLSPSQTAIPVSTSGVEKKGIATPSPKAAQGEKIRTAAPASSTSIAAQVDNILQEMLAGTPLEKKAIRLMELPEQGMFVMVGLQKYETVDEVPDETVRAVIRTAVQRWENSTKVD